MIFTKKAVPFVVILLVGSILLAAAPAVSNPWFVFVTTTDFSTGSSSTIDLDGSYAETINVASIHSDAVARYHNGHIYVINRFGADNIQILDPTNNFGTVRQFSTGNGSNPQDVVVIRSDKMYVSRNDANALWIMNPQTGAQTGSIDLSPFADGDGLCEMQYMYLVGDRLFVALQRLDRNNFWQPAGTSYIAVIDINTDTLIDADSGTSGVQATALANADPFSEIQIDPWSGNLYVACVGFWGLQDGGVETVDPVAMVSTGTVFTESAAGGDILDVEIINDRVGYCIIQNSSFHTDLISFDPSTGTKLQTIYSPGDYVLQDIDRGPTGELFLCDSTPLSPGVRVYDAQSGVQITSGPIDVGLPPFDLTFNVDVPTGVGTPTPPATLQQNYPNPFNPSTTIPFSLARSAHVVLDIYDVTGARVVVLVDEVLPAGDHEVRWNGLSAGSRRSPSGVYFARLRAGDFVQYRKLVLLK
jgi:hypothetical protein